MIIYRNTVDFCILTFYSLIFPIYIYFLIDLYAMLCYAKSLQSCPTLCDPIDGSPPGSPVPGILQARTLEWVDISFSSAWKWKVKVKLLSHVWLFTIPWTAAYQALPSMGVSRKEYWGGIIMLAVGFSLNSFYQVEEITSYSYIVRYFYHIS